MLIAGIVALHLARRVRNDTEPLFPDAPRVDADPVAFTERLARDGSFQDDTAQFAHLAARGGFHQAYALLAHAAGDETSPVRAAVPAAAAPAEPRGSVATLVGGGAEPLAAAQAGSRHPVATLDGDGDEQRRLAIFLAQVADVRAAQSRLPTRPVPQASAPEPGVPPAAETEAEPEPEPEPESVETPAATADVSIDDDLLPSRRRRGSAS
jgi:hypothetical protein